MEPYFLSEGGIYCRHNKEPGKCCPNPLRKGIDTTTGQAGICLMCDKYMEQGPDICLGYVPNVTFACCGHGDPYNAYVVIGGLPNQVIENPRKIYGIKAYKWLMRHKKKGAK